MPESPRYLIKVGREEEGRYILGRLRGEQKTDGLGRAETEFQEICQVVQLERESSYVNSYWKMFFGIGSGKLHIGRRVQLVIWLQILQEWIGIAGITIYGPTIFEIAAQGISMFAAGGLARATMNAAQADKGKVGGAATFFVFLYTAVFGATWLTVPWIYPAEIFPLEVRARGNAWGVVGWSIGNGWCVLLLPTIFQKLNEKTLYLFGAVNILTIFTTWAFYVETNGRSLEDIDLLFTSRSWFVWDNERDFVRLKAEQGDRVREEMMGKAAAKSLEERRDTLVGEEANDGKETKEVLVEHAA
ncbi:hypothetical protein QFC19_006449 [Naganishia cerealis]|uniref:Uncharacterized protein n=1 Tax=Naganishia cerealis TaxID=610337 RepID=A0ACC2VHD7_9TREE|nr:hypothetical protein QFC19_006449 [Naganishia cerealis]